MVLGALKYSITALRFLFHKRSQQIDFTVVNETGNILLGVAIVDVLNPVEHEKWQNKIARFLLLLRVVSQAVGSRSLRFSVLRPALITCPWLAEQGNTFYGHNDFSLRSALKRVARVLYSDHSSPGHCEKAQRLLLSLSRQAAYLAAEAAHEDERLTLLVFKCFRVGQEIESRIYLYSFDLETLRQLHKVFHHKWAWLRPVRVVVREDCFVFK